MSEWLPVTERLPETLDTVIVADDEGVTCGWYDRGVWSLSERSPWIDPTHWMPLPEPPEDV